RQCCDRRDAPSDVARAGELPLENARARRELATPHGRALAQRLLNRRLILLLRDRLVGERALHPEPVAWIGSGVGFALRMGSECGELGKNENGRDDEDGVLEL